MRKCGGGSGGGNSGGNGSGSSGGSNDGGAGLSPYPLHFLYEFYPRPMDLINILKWAQAKIGKVYFSAELKKSKNVFQIISR